MDERYSIYLNETPTREDFYMGNIKGYVLDSMVADEDLYQFEKTCDYFSYEDILSESGILRPLLQVYRERELNGTEIRITNRNHRKDFFNARGFYVLKENSDLISGFIQEYEGIFAETQKEVLEAISFWQCKDKFSIHRGDFVFYDVNKVEKQEIDWDEYKRRQERARSKADMYKAQATLNRAASMMLMGPGSAPMSAGNSALIGGALAGTTGALIGAASGLEQQRKYNESVNSYNISKNEYLSRTEELSRKAAEMEALAISGDYPYKTVIGGEFCFGIRTLFGIIPAIHDFGENKIEVGLRTLSDRDKTVDSSSSISIVEIEDDRARERRWKSICACFEKGVLDVNISEAIPDVVELLREMLNCADYNGVIEKGQRILEIDPHNADVLVLLTLAEGNFSSIEEVIEKRCKISETKYGVDIIKYGSKSLVNQVQEIDRRIDERIEFEKDQKRKQEKRLEEQARLKEIKELNEKIGYIKNVEELNNIKQRLVVYLQVENPDEIARKVEERIQHIKQDEEKQKQEEKRQRRKGILIKAAVVLGCIGAFATWYIYMGSQAASSKEQVRENLAQYGYEQFEKEGIPKLCNDLNEKTPISDFEVASSEYTYGMEDDDASNSTMMIRVLVTLKSQQIDDYYTSTSFIK